MGQAVYACMNPCGRTELLGCLMRLSKVCRREGSGTAWTVPRSKYMPASPDLQAGNSRWGIFALRARHATTQQRAGAGDHRIQRLSFTAKRNEHMRQTGTIQHTKSDRSGRTTWRVYRLCFCLSMNNPTQLTLASNRSTTIPSIIE
ncbi:uncharacterized protein K489DRAFT_233480 [Dissoconium aciculare CBS 342.82]|uniref:Uncharacterized protein n=1 Tax=Dissoconium aciculare CBS 342.82 TaxID=1314786 RepID=A0A6J3M294_9PEZI|nr:uncharacterized protein K489DRAFT_233480 [Dissoconium aciculare CBS 342.82]KAF1822126.1 hypothetical protein K489DRAFT_233480 [Dissoconium aciculare CBS 342.82]